MAASIPAARNRPIPTQGPGWQSTRCRRWHSETPDYPFCCDNDDREHDGRFHQLGHSYAETRDSPEYANWPEHEARPEYEREIEYACFQDFHTPCRLSVYFVYFLENEIPALVDGCGHFDLPDLNFKRKASLSVQ